MIRKTRKFELVDGKEITFRLSPMDRLIVEVMAEDNDVDVATELEIQYDSFRRTEVSLRNGMVTLYT